MKLSQAFPSNFLKADDLGGQTPVVTISEVTLEEIGQGRDKEQKLIIAFQGKSKKMVCNKTNASTIAKLHGDDTDLWIGQRITLLAREVEFQGEMVLGLRVSLQKPGQMAGQAAPGAASAPTRVFDPAPPSRAPVGEPDREVQPNDETLGDIPF